MMLQDILNQLKPVDSDSYSDCIRRFDSIAKPVGSLGQLEYLLAQIAAVQRNEIIDISKKCALVFCADNGVVVEGVAQGDHEVTSAIARMLIDKKSCVCVMAQSVGADVFPVDVGMVDIVNGMISKKLMNGTGNIAVEAAMSLEVAISAINLGFEFAGQKAAEGYKLISVGESGIGNTTTASAMASFLLCVPPEEVTGRGAGLSDEGLSRKIDAIKRAISVNKPNPKEPIDILHKLGGIDIAVMVGAYLGGAAFGVPMVMDGVISAVAALCAVRLAPLVRDYIIPSHISAEPAGKLLCKAMDFEPIIHANMRLGEGTGAVALFPLLDMVAAVYHNAATFDNISVDGYTRDLC